MSMPRANLTNKRFGNLVAMHHSGGKNNNSVLWVCRCDCGNERTVTVSMLGGGHATHCGCQTGANISSGKIKTRRQYKTYWERKKRYKAYACKPVRPDNGPLDRFLYAHPAPVECEAVHP